MEEQQLTHYPLHNLSGLSTSMDLIEFSVEFFGESALSSDCSYETDMKAVVNI